jgi:hypothetical protein
MPPTSGRHGPPFGGKADLQACARWPGNKHGADAKARTVKGYLDALGASREDRTGFISVADVSIKIRVIARATIEPGASQARFRRRHVVPNSDETDDLPP